MPPGNDREDPTNVTRTEAAPGAGTAELIVDITTTGTPLAANGLKVIDDGVGFDPEAVGIPKGHWGIVGMRERAERMRGQLSILSRPHHGTTVELIAPRD